MTYKVLPLFPAGYSPTDESTHHCGKLEVLCAMLEHLFTNTQEKIVLVSNYTQVHMHSIVHGYGFIQQRGVHQDFPFQLELPPHQTYYTRNMLHLCIHSQCTVTCTRADWVDKPQEACTPYFHMHAILNAKPSLPGNLCTCICTCTM